MKTQSAIHMVVVCLAAFLIIGGTTAVFHTTQSYSKLVMLGKKYYMKNDFANAKIHFEKAVQYQPNNLEIARYLTMVYRILNMKLDLVKTLWILYKDDPSDTKIAEELADALYSQSDLNKAEILYKSILQYKESLAVREKLAEVLVWQKKYDEALPMIEQLLTIDPHDRQLKKLYTNVLVWNRDYQKAIGLLEELHAAQPANMEIMKYLSISYRGLGMGDKLIEELRLMYSKHPSDTALAEELADVLYSQSDYEQAEALYKKILDKELNGEVQGKLAEVLVWQTKYDEALPIIEQLLMSQSNNEALYELYLNTLVWSKQYDKAIPLLEKINADSQCPQAKKELLAYVYTWNQMYDKAIPLFEDLIAQYPDNTDMREQLADIYSWTKSYDNSIHLYQSLLTPTSHDKDIIFKLAETLRLAGKDEQAVQLYKQYFMHD